MTQNDDYVGQVAAIDESIRLLRKADRWRWHKRNRDAISHLMITRVRVVQASHTTSSES